MLDTHSNPATPRLDEVGLGFGRPQSLTNPGSLTGAYVAAAFVSTLDQHCCDLPKDNHESIGQLHGGARATGKLLAQHAFEFFFWWHSLSLATGAGVRIHACRRGQGMPCPRIRPVLSLAVRPRSIHDRSCSRCRRARWCGPWLH